MSNLHQAGQLDSASLPIPLINKTANESKLQSASVVFRAGLACGILDITAAFLTWLPRGVSPYRLLQAIASGLLGVEAYHGGWVTAILGAALHFFIAFSVATVFYFASRKLNFMTRRPVLSGMAFGVSVYLVMYYVVMPLSRLQPMPFSFSRTLIAIVTHMFCVGLPISLIVRRYSA
jgi:magnesium-transporting ATPase (P-type)